MESNLKHNIQEDIRVLLVDESIVFRDTLKSILKSVKSIKVVGELSDERNVLKYLNENNVDVILLEAISNVKLIKEHYPNIRIIGLSSYDYEREMLEAGAHYFFNKWQASHTDIKKAIIES